MILKQKMEKEEGNGKNKWVTISPRRICFAIKGKKSATKFNLKNNCLRFVIKK